MVSGLKRRTPSSWPPFSIICAKRARSSAVENTPACPATPPILRAVGSCTTPRSGAPPFSRSVRDPRDPGGGWLELGLLHAQWQKNVFARVIGNHLPAQPVDQFAQQNKIDVAVDESPQRRALRLGDGGQMDAGLVAGPRFIERHVRRQAGEVREQVA